MKAPDDDYEPLYPIDENYENRPYYQIYSQGGGVGAIGQSGGIGTIGQSGGAVILPPPAQYQTPGAATKQQTIQKTSPTIAPTQGFQIPTGWLLIGGAAILGLFLLSDDKK